MWPRKIGPVSCHSRRLLSDFRMNAPFLVAMSKATELGVGVGFAFLVRAGVMLFLRLRAKIGLHTRKCVLDKSGCGYEKTARKLERQWVAWSSQTLLAS